MPLEFDLRNNATCGIAHVRPHDWCEVQAHALADFERFGKWPRNLNYLGHFSKLMRRRIDNDNARTFSIVASPAIASKTTRRQKPILKIVEFLIFLVDLVECLLVLFMSTPFADGLR